MRVRPKKRKLCLDNASDDESEGSDLVHRADISKEVSKIMSLLLCINNKQLRTLILDILQA